MKIDKSDTEKIGKSTVPFFLAIFLALLLEDVWSAMTIAERLLLVFALVSVFLLVFRKKVWEILR